MLTVLHFPQDTPWPFSALIPPRNFLFSLLLPGLLDLFAAFPVCCSLPQVGSDMCVFTCDNNLPLRKAAPSWVWGAKQKSVSVSIPRGISRQIKMQSLSIKITRSMLALWHQQAAPGMQAALPTAVATMLGNAGWYGDDWKSHSAFLPKFSCLFLHWAVS